MNPIVLLPGEDTAAYQSVQQAIHAHFRPANAYEELLVERIAATGWRYVRAAHIEAAFMADRAEALAEGNPDASATGHPSTMARLFIDPEQMKKVSLMMRYLKHASSEHRDAIAALREAQRNRQIDDISALEYDESAEMTERGFEAEPEPEPEPYQPEPVKTVRLYPPSDLTRAERRAMERAERKAAKRAARDGQTGQQNGFVSQNGSNAQQNGSVSHIATDRELAA